MYRSYKRGNRKIRLINTSKKYEQIKEVRKGNTHDNRSHSDKTTGSLFLRERRSSKKDALENYESKRSGRPRQS